MHQRLPDDDSILDDGPKITPRGHDTNRDKGSTSSPSNIICPKGDSLSKKLHATPPPQHWTEWPNIPSKTQHKCAVKDGVRVVSEAHQRTLALQVYPDLVLPVGQRRFVSFVEGVFATSEALVWSSVGKVAFPPCYDKDANDDAPTWEMRSSSSKLMPMLTSTPDSGALTFLNNAFPGTQWGTLTSERRLALVAFPRSRLLHRVVCHTRLIIAVLHGNARLVWTTPALFYSGLPVVRQRNCRHSVDINFAESTSLRDFNIVDNAQVGYCAYVRAGALIQLAVSNDTVLAMVVEAGSTSTFQRLSEWLRTEKGTSTSPRNAFIMNNLL